MVGLIWHAYQVCCSRSPFPRNRPLLTHASTGDTQTLKARSGSVSCGVPGSWWTQGFVWALQSSLAGMGFDSKCGFAHPTILLGLLLCPWMCDIFFGGIQHSPINSCSAVSWNFGVLTGEDEHTSFYSVILLVQHKSHKSEWRPWAMKTDVEVNKQFSSLFIYRLSINTSGQW